MRGLQALLARGRRTRGTKKRDPHWLAPPRHAPGTAAVSWFFDSYPRFYETSRTGAVRGRLNLRYEAIFAENRDVFEGARVLDLASHDGRWSLAALKNGAAEVVGIEADEELHASACESLGLYCDGDRYRFVCGDLFDVLSRERFEAEVVLCLGFLYHTIRYNELMARIRDIGPRHLIVDTDVLRRRDRPFIRLTRDPVEYQANAAGDAFTYGGKVLVGTPSIAALELLLDTYDFELERFSDWPALIRDNLSLGAAKDYATGKRVTVRCVSRV
jgi:hypothetical protein